MHNRKIKKLKYKTLKKKLKNIKINKKIKKSVKFYFLKKICKKVVIVSLFTQKN